MIDKNKKNETVVSHITRGSTVYTYQYDTHTGAYYRRNHEGRADAAAARESYRGMTTKQLLEQAHDEDFGDAHTSSTNPKPRVSK